MTPAGSWPKMRGGGRAPDWIFLMSVGQTPHAATRTNSSSGPMRGTGTVSRRRLFAPRYTTARMVRGIFSMPHSGFESRPDVRANEGGARVVTAGSQAVCPPALTDKIAKPLFRLRREHGFPSVPMEPRGLRVQGLVRQEQSGALGVTQAPLHEGQVQCLVPAVQFLAHDRLSVMREMT